jgi:hypothetical protein
MSILVKGTDFGPTEQVTSTKLDNLVDAAKFTNTSETAVSYTGSTGTCLQGGGLEVTTAGQLQIQDGEVDLVKLSTNNQLNSGLYGVLDKVYPVGSIYISTVSTTPDTLIFGGNSDTTWVAFGAGKTLIGIDSGDTDFDTVEETGGDKTKSKTIALNELPNHKHAVPNSDCRDYSGEGYSSDTINRNSWCDTNGYGLANAPLTGNGVYADDGTRQTQQAMTLDVVQPYIVTYMWKRTA